MGQTKVREAFNGHLAASDASDFDVEHGIYREDALLEYRRSGERIGRQNTTPGGMARKLAAAFERSRGALRGCRDGQDASLELR